MATGQPSIAEGCLLQWSLLKAPYATGTQVDPIPNPSGCPNPGQWCPQNTRHLTPTPGLAAVLMGLEPLLLQACKWEKQNSSLTPSREPNWGW